MKVRPVTRLFDRLGSSGRRLTPLGFGGAAIGNLYRRVSEADAHASVAAAWASGVRYFDVAPHYGFGLAESRLSAALSDLDPAGEALISTKVGRVLEPIAADQAQGERHGFVDAAAFEPRFDYSHDGVMRSLEASLKRLGRDHIDILLAHDLGAATHGADDAAHWAAFMDGGYKAMLSLRDQGVVRAIGLGANEAAVCRRALDQGDFDVFLLAGRYTLLEQAPLDDLLPACTQAGVSLIVGGPFNSGVLACAAPAGNAHYDYGAPPAWVTNKVAALRGVCARFGVELPAAALQFPLAHSAVVSVIPGAADAEEARLAAARIAAPIPAGFWQALHAEGLIDSEAPVPLVRQAA